MAETLTKQRDGLYERDFYAWTQDQAAKLRARAVSDNFGDIDWENAAEEIESLGRSDKREIRNRLRVLIAHLLKWQFQPEKRNTGWRKTIIEQRQRLQLLLDESPSLQSYPQAEISGIYLLALSKAAEETGRDRRLFPSMCPYDLGEVLDEEFYPDEIGKALRTP